MSKNKSRPQEWYEIGWAEGFEAGCVWGAAIVAAFKALKRREAFRCKDCGEIGQPVEFEPYTVCRDYDACTLTIQRKEEAKVPDEGDW